MNQRIKTEKMKAKMLKILEAEINKEVKRTLKGSKKPQAIRESVVSPVQKYHGYYMGKQKRTIFIKGQEIPTYQTIWESNRKRDARIDRMRNAIVILSVAVMALAVCNVLIRN